MKKEHGSNGGNGTNPFLQEIDRIPPKPCEAPHINGSKPAEQIRVPEIRKKHIKRDGRK